MSGEVSKSTEHFPEPRSKTALHHSPERLTLTGTYFEIKKKKKKKKRLKEITLNGSIQLV